MTWQVPSQDARPTLCSVAWAGHLCVDQQMSGQPLLGKLPHLLLTFFWPLPLFGQGLVVEDKSCFTSSPGPSPLSPPP